MVTILHTADLHLGRHPTRIPAELDGPQFSGRSTWAAIVEHAIRSGVDAVTVSGDVVDQENRYFEAFGAFGDGARALANAGIPLVVVGGNHDFDVLPRMVEDLDIDTVTMLGADGTWDRHTIERDGRPIVHFDGWSFPTRHHHGSPIATYDLPAPQDAPVVGLLHADLDAMGSTYAPVASNELAATSPAAWLLGHIHKPGVLRDADPLVLYPGSPQPLSPGEPGTHGPWLVEIDESGRTDVQQVPLATLRYDTIQVDATGAGDPKHVAKLVSEAIETHAAMNVDTQRLELYLPRVRLVGRTPAHGAINDTRRDIEEQLDFRVDTVPVIVERLRVDTRPDVDLDELAGTGTPAGVVARLLVDLDNGTVDPGLVQGTLDAIRAARAGSAYSALRREGRAGPPDEADAIDVLREQALLVLDALLAQKEVPA